MREIQRETSGEIMAEALEVVQAQHSCLCQTLVMSSAPLNAVPRCRTTFLSGTSPSEGLLTPSSRYIDTTVHTSRITAHHWLACHKPLWLACVTNFSVLSSCRAASIMAASSFLLSTPSSLLPSSWFPPAAALRLVSKFVCPCHHITQSIGSHRGVYGLPWWL